MKRKWIIAPLMPLLWAFFSFGQPVSGNLALSLSNGVSKDSGNSSKAGVEALFVLPQVDVDADDHITGSSSLPSGTFMPYIPRLWNLKAPHISLLASRPLFLLFHEFRFYG